MHRLRFLYRTVCDVDISELLVGQIKRQVPASFTPLSPSAGRIRRCQKEFRASHNPSLRGYESTARTATIITILEWRDF